MSKIKDQNRYKEKHKSNLSVFFLSLFPFLLFWDPSSLTRVAPVPSTLKHRDFTTGSARKLPQTLDLFSYGVILGLPLPSNHNSVSSLTL